MSIYKYIYIYMYRSMSVYATWVLIGSQLFVIFHTTKIVFCCGRNTSQSVVRVTLALII